MPLPPGTASPPEYALPHEKGGLIPTRKWKKRRFGEIWHPGENLNFSIGQGYVLVTPLQVARSISSLINGGRLLRPQLLAGEPAEEQGVLPLTDQSTRINPQGHDCHRR